MEIKRKANPVTKNNTAGEGSPKIKKVVRPIKKSNNYTSLILLFIITSSFVGGGTYYWLDKTNKEHAEKVRKEVDEERYSLERRIDNLKESLLGTEKENEELKLLKEELEQKENLLSGAKRDYQNDTLGISFEYPATFGEVELSISNEDGKYFNGQFTNNSSLVFGGVGIDYIEGYESTFPFINTQGFLKDKDKYYFLPAGDEVKDYELNPAKIISVGGNEVLLVDNKSFASQGEKKINIGENVGYLVNLNKENFKGIAFMNTDFRALPLEKFEELIKSLKTN